MTLSQREWTYEDYLELPDDGNRYEVIHGVLYMSPSPTTIHQILSKRMQHLLYQLELAGVGYVFSAPMDLLMPGATPVQPDLIYYTAEQKSSIRKKNLQGPPCLIVEILSPSTSARDRVVKLNLYGANGVPHYWLLDPDQTLMLLRLDGDTYRVVTTLGPGDRHEPPEFPGLVLDMDALFADLPEE